jgi:hypothetical protein
MPIVPVNLRVTCPRFELQNDRRTLLDILRGVGYTESLGLTAGSPGGWGLVLKHRDHIC